MRGFGGTKGKGKCYNYIIKNNQMPFKKKGLTS